MTFRLLGGVVRLQVQRAPLKPGLAPDRVYDPTPLLEVPSLLAGPRGVLGLPGDGTEVLDVHHRDHPETRDAKGRAGFTVMTVADYDRLREEFGPHVIDGCAGETALIEGDRPVGGQDLYVESVAGSSLHLTEVRVAKPCVEFARFCRGADLEADAEELREAMALLDDGGRGFRARAIGTPTVIEAGARIWAGDVVPVQRAPEGQPIDVTAAGHPGEAHTRR